jgi:hypothetical protein
MFSLGVAHIDAVLQRAQDNGTLDEIELLQELSEHRHRHHDIGRWALLYFVVFVLFCLFVLLFVCLFVFLFVWLFYFILFACLLVCVCDLIFFLKFGSCRIWQSRSSIDRNVR